MLRPFRRFLRRLPPRHEHKSLSQHRTRLWLEILEGRTLPAVSASFAAATGTLTIIDPDTTGHAITVQGVDVAAGSRWSVVVDGAALSLPNGGNINVVNINANLGADSDTINFQTGTSASGTIPTSTLKGSLTVIAGDGHDTVGIGFTTIRGNLIVRQGNGTDTIVQRLGTIMGNASFLQGAGNGDNMEMDASVIAGNLSLIQGKGSSDTIVQRQAHPGTTIGGNAFVAQGNGAGDQIDIDSWSWGASNVSLSQGNGLGDQIDIESWSWGTSNPSLSQGSGAGDQIEIHSWSWGVGTASLIQGDGANDTVRVTAPTAPSMPAQPAWDISITQGNGNDDLAVCPSVGIQTATTGRRRLAVLFLEPR